MCSGKLREDLQGLQVKPGGLLDVSLLSLDVGQIVQRIGMGRVQPEVSENEKKIKNESQVQPLETSTIESWITIFKFCKFFITSSKIT